MNLYTRTINVTPEIELDCNACVWRLPTTCKSCRVEGGIEDAELRGNVSLSKQHPDKETYTLMRRQNGQY